MKGGILNIKGFNTLIESTKGNNINITNLKISRYDEKA